MKNLVIVMCFSLGLLAGPVTAQSQNPYAAAIEVNDSIVTNFEILQRMRMMQAFGTRGDLQALAEDQLIDDRLRTEAARARNIAVDEDELLTAMDEFAARGNLSAEQLIQYLEQRGVYPETFRDFVSAGVVWRSFIRAKFGAQAVISDREIDTAIGLNALRQQEEILFSEIVIPTQERGEEATKELARNLSQSIRSQGAFSSAARRYSRSPSAGRGGRLNWVSANSLPPNVVGQILALQPGEVTGPIELNGAIALFMLRDSRLVSSDKRASTILTYATVPLPYAGDRARQLGAAKELFDWSDNCSDLRAVSERFGENLYTEAAGSVSEIPSSIALELAKLDPDEGSTYVTASGNLAAVMLCSRNLDTEEEIDREGIRNALFGQRMSGFAEGYLQELKADAIIVRK